MNPDGSPSYTGGTPYLGVPLYSGPTYTGRPPYPGRPPMYPSGPYFGKGRPMNPQAIAFYQFCYGQGTDPHYNDEVYRASMVDIPQVRAIPTLFRTPKLRLIQPSAPTSMRSRTWSCLLPRRIPLPTEQKGEGEGEGEGEGQSGRDV